MALTMRCENCLRKNVKRPRDACVIEALLAMLIDRGVDPRKVMKLWAKLDSGKIDEIWDTIGPVVDELEDQAEAEEL